MSIIAALIITLGIYFIGKSCVIARNLIVTKKFGGD